MGIDLQWRMRSWFEISHKISRIDLERRGEAEDVDEGGVPLSTFHSADVRPVETGRCGESLL